MPYAYGATIQHVFDTDHLDIYVTFLHPMQRSAIPQASPPVYNWMPPLNLWLLECDEVALDIIDSAWQDEHTLLLTSDEILAGPDKVTLEYTGPDEHLCTTWGKNWELWGPLPSFEGWPTTFKQGMIILWSGSVVSIPSGWHLCDGTVGTPDLRNNFVVGAGSTWNPNDVGGATIHTHEANQASHYHTLTAGAGIPGGTVWSPTTNSKTPAITISTQTHLPPYYALCYIMKL